MHPHLKKKTALDLALHWLILDETGEESTNDPSRNDPATRCATTHTREIFEVTLWERLAAERLPRGLDYYVLDCAFRFTIDDVQRWLNLSLRLPPENKSFKLVETCLQQQTVRDTILLMDAFVRRKLKTDPGWMMCKHWWTNRANRVRDRAVALSRETF